MTPQKLHQTDKPDKGHRINVILTDSQYELLKAYAIQEETTMSEAIRNLVKAIKLKKPKPDK